MMKRTRRVLALLACVATTSCLKSSGPLPVRNEEGPIPPHIANKPQGRVGIFSPWIADGKPGIFTPTGDFRTGEIYGLVHGMGVTSGSSRFIVEQWLLMKDSVLNPYYGLKLTKLPDYLPLVEKDTIHIGKLFWGFGRYPFGYPSPSMAAKDFYDWAVPIVAPKVNPVAYGFGVAGVHEEIPPDHLQGLGGNPIDLDTEGYVETFAVTDGCRFTVFAELTFSRFTNTTRQPFFDRFERVRRFVQANDTKSCASLQGAGTQLGTASTNDSPRKKYRDWLDIIKNWTDAEVSYADGTVLLDDNFTGEPMDLTDLKKQLAPLLAPKK